MFRRSIRNASETLPYKGELADDVVLLACLKEAVFAAIEAYIEVASFLCLTVSFPKTKFIVVGATVSVDDQQPFAVGDGLIEWVNLFPYLGSVIEDKRSIDTAVDRRIANASRAFGALHQSVFDNCYLSIKPKRCVYQACVL